MENMRQVMRMKKLLVMRHAKSSWDDAALADFERPLNDRGLLAAPFMGEVLRREGLVPDALVASPAVRSAQTAEAVSSAGGFDGGIIFEEGIYEASPNALRQAVAAIDDTASTAMLIGHNPGIEGFIQYLTGEVEPMPTAAIAVISLDVNTWAEATGGCGRVETVFRPKDLMVAQ